MLARTLIAAAVALTLAAPALAHGHHGPGFPGGLPPGHLGPIVGPPVRTSPSPRPGAPIGLPPRGPGLPQPLAMP